MKSSGMIGKIALATMLALSMSFVYSSEEKKVSDEMRKKIVDDFERSRLNTTPGDAMMLRILVESRNAQRGIEVGSADGYGAMNMGIAFERTGGHLFTLEIDPQRVKDCRENLAKMGLSESVTCIEGDALKTLGTLEGEFDFVFIDAVKSDYIKYFRLIEPKLKPGAVIVADNVIRSAEAMKEYLDLMQNSPDYDTVIIRASEEKGDGMAISYKIR